jgi:hypothetical protein
MFALDLALARTGQVPPVVLVFPRAIVRGAAVRVRTEPLRTAVVPGIGVVAVVGIAARVFI